MLNEIFHQPIRTQIYTYLYSVDRASFKDIKSTLNLTDGHMSTHMKVFMRNGYITCKKAFKDGKPLTTYSMTNIGKIMFVDYIKELQSITNYVMDNIK